MLEKSKEFISKNISDFQKEDIHTFQEIIKYHSDLYYNKEEPIISDYEYDVLLEKLQELESHFNISEKIGENVGSELIESSFEKVKHSRPMTSLGNTYNEDDLLDFDERVKKNIIAAGKSYNKTEYVLEFKFDGLGIELIYKNGELVQAITRGNGVEGEDVTMNAMQIANIPKKIPYKKHLEVRGEVVLPLSSFEKLNEQAKKDGTKIFSNPRNAASGSLRMKDNSVTKKRNLKFFAFDLANFDEYTNNINNKNYFDVIQSLYGLGFEKVDYFKKVNNISEIIDEIHNFGDVRKNIDFEIDGLVIKVNNISLWKPIGFTEHHPRYAIAYKFPAEILTTKIDSVVHQVGRTGTITPVANLEPINIGGVTVKRATLHNYEEVENLGVHIGDSVFIKRAGEVIPKIISVIKEGRPDEAEKIFPPKNCPSCGTSVIKDGEKVRFFCPNKSECPAQHSEKLIFAVGKQGFNIDGLGIKQVELFLDLGLIQNLSDIFVLGDKADQILLLDGFKEKSVQNLKKGIEKARDVDISTFLCSLGINGVGKKTAKNLSKLFINHNDIIDFSHTLEQLIELDDIGPEIARNVIEYFKSEHHKYELKKLVDVLDIKYYQPVVVENNGEQSLYFGKKMCITGSFIIDEKKIAREDLVKKLESVGGEFVSSVSKNTDYLLAGEKAGSKLKKANDLGVTVLNLEEFLNKIET